MTDTIPAALSPAPAAPLAATPLHFEFFKRPGLFKIVLVNFLLGMITLGFYRFWGKTNVRRHIWSSVHINDEPLEYTGTGMELFKGFLVVMGAIVVPYALLVTAVTIMAGPESPWIGVLQLIFVLFVQVFWGYAVYKARKFQLSRTNWRGIRGTLVGSPMTYSLTYFGSILAKGASLGWATPVMNTLLSEQITNDMRFGDAAFKFKGRAGPLYPTYAICWLLTLLALIAIPFIVASVFGGMTNLFEQLRHALDPSDITFDSTAREKFFITLGIVLASAFVAYMVVIPALWAIYTAKELRTFANYTRFDGAQFHLDATARSVIWLAIINFLIIVLTLGIATPFAQRRLVKFVVDRLRLDGAVDIHRIAQSQARMDSRGEGLADAFDVGGL